MSNKGIALVTTLMLTAIYVAVGPLENNVTLGRGIIFASCVVAIVLSLALSGENKGN